MAAFVLVHGGWAGGWQWRQVATLLDAAGHVALSPTLTGCGERVHLANAQIDLDLHTEDIVDVLEYEDLRDVILVGHSYGGMVITNVAERTPHRLRHLVFLDAFAPHDAESLMDMIGQVLGSAAVAQIEDLVRTQGDGWRFPRSPVDSDGVPNPRATDHPVRTLTHKMQTLNIKKRFDAS